MLILNLFSILVLVSVGISVADAGVWDEEESYWDSFVKGTNHFLSDAVGYSEALWKKTFSSPQPNDLEGPETSWWRGYAQSSKDFFSKSVEFSKNTFSKSVEFSKEVYQKVFKQCKVKENAANVLGRLLDEEVYGQHITVPFVKYAVEGHLSNQNPTHPLTMVFMGATGIGKNFITQLMSSAMFGDDKSEYITVFPGRMAFPDESRLDDHRKNIISTLTSKIQVCDRAVFVFDEFEKMPPGVIDAIVPFLKHKKSMNDVSLAKSIFIFITNLGSTEIQDVYRELGVGLEYEDVEKRLKPVLYSLEGYSSLFKSGLVNLYLPFLPLTESTVRRCINREFRRAGKRITEASMEAVLSKMTFDEYGYSESGCKRVDTFAHVEIYRSYKKEL